MALPFTSPEFYENIKKLESEGYRRLTREELQKNPEYPIVGAIVLLKNDKGDVKSVHQADGSIKDFNPPKPPKCQGPQCK